MKISYYAETDSIYIELRPGPGTETREVASGLNVDLDAEGNVVGFDIDGASARYVRARPSWYASIEKRQTPSARSARGTSR